jgi:predicted GIY-YIG superfamily endonuclease
MSSKSGVRYIGATNDLERCVFEHQQGLIDGFTKEHRVRPLICVEQFDRPTEMVARENSARRTARDPSLRQPPLRMTEGAEPIAAGCESTSSRRIS